jgi:hypothetical protein
MKRQARAGARASAYEVARAMARSSSSFDMFERPGILRRFAWLYSCSFVRLLRLVPPDELRLREPLDRELRLCELLPLERPLRELLPDVLRLLELLPDELRLLEPLPERDLLPELREPLELDEPDDLDPLREDREPERLFDPEALLRRERLDPPLERELRALDPRCDCRRAPCCRPSCCSPSSSPSSFFATVTAAGTAIPIAAPARAFLPVDIPS